MHKFTFLFCYLILLCSCKKEIDNKELILETQSVVGKWKIKKRSTSSDKTISNCIFYSIIFSSNESFAIEMENSYIYGEYSFEGDDVITLNVENSKYGVITNIDISSDEFSFSISIDNYCSEDIEASRDTRYKNDENCSLDNDVQIGNQIWMTKNLAVNSFKNGDPIPFEPDPEKWKDLKTPAYTYYNNDLNNKSTYGLLYNWYALNDQRGLAPDGYRIPTKSDFEELTTYLGLETIETEDVSYAENKGVAEKLKSLSYWNYPNDNTNDSCFDALPGGFVQSYNENEGGWGYGNLGGQGVFWTKTENLINREEEAYYFILSYPSIGQQIGAQLIRNNIAMGVIPKTQGFSVRCIKE